jgi:nitrous oxide reductase accessory protein NosL
MKKLIAIMLSAVCLLTGAYALAAEKVEAPESCLHCGMDRTKFAHSRMLIEYDDGSAVGLCSLNCAAIDMEEKKSKKVKSIMVADYNTKELIGAEKAFWVIGGDKKGVMTMTPKWAFAKKEDAEKFIAESGGELGTFETALKLAKDDKRMKGMKKMGEGAGTASAPGKGKCCCCK